MIERSRDIGKVSFSGNPMLLQVRSYDYDHTFYTIFLRIAIDNDFSASPTKIYELSANVDASGYCQFDLSPVIRKHTSVSLSQWPIDVNFQAVKNSNDRVRFYIELSEWYGTPFAKVATYAFSNPYYAIPGGLPDHILNNIEVDSSNCFNFLESNGLLLSSQPPLKRTQLLQPEIFRYFNHSDSSLAVKLKVKQYNLQGTAVTSTVWSGSLDALSLYTFNVSPNISFTLGTGGFSSWEAFLTNSADAPITESLSWALHDFPLTNPRTFVFQNSLGGLDTVLSSGSRTITNEGDSTKSFQAGIGTVRKWLTPIQDRRLTQSVYRGTIGFFSNDELRWLKEFFLSERKLLDVEGKLEHITLRQTEFTGETDEPPGRVEIEADLGSPFMFFF